MTGSDLKLSGTRQDFDTRTGEPIVLMEFTDKGGKKFEDDHARHRAAREAPLQHGRRRPGRPERLPAALRDRARPRDQVVADDRLHASTRAGSSGSNGAQISGLQSIREAKNLALVLQTGALPVEFRTLDQTAISATLGKDSLREAKLAAAVGLLAVALFLLIFYRFLGLVAVVGLDRLRGAAVRRDPPLQRHAHAPGHRRPRADTGGGRRREHRHLRTHQGRGARRALRARGDPDRLHEGLRDDRRRERRHRDHRARAVRRRDRERARLRADAARRYGDVDAHGGARDARAPRRARRLQAAREPEADGRRRAAGSPAG